MLNGIEDLILKIGINIVDQDKENMRIYYNMDKYSYFEKKNSNTSKLDLELNNLTLNNINDTT